MYGGPLPDGRDHVFINETLEAPFLGRGPLRNDRRTLWSGAVEAINSAVSSGLGS